MDLSGVECREVLVEVELYLDGELPDGRCREIERHLLGCSPCLGRVEFRRDLKGMVRRTCGNTPVPAELVERIRRLLGSS